MITRRTMLAGVGAAAGAVAMPNIVRAQAPLVLNGASQFNDDHAFTKALARFGEIVKKEYGKPIEFVLHKNSSLGLEKQYFEYMAQGKAVDFAVVSATCSWPTTWRVNKPPDRQRITMPTRPADSSFNLLTNMVFITPSVRAAARGDTRVAISLPAMTAAAASKAAANRAGGGAAAPRQSDSKATDHAADQAMPCC